MTRLIYFAAAASLTLLAPLVAQAQDRGFYIGAAAGPTFIKDVEFDDFYRAESPTTVERVSDARTADDSITWSAFAGYTLFEPVAIEFGYIRYGRFFAPARNTLHDTINVRAAAWTLDAIVDVPVIYRLSVVGALGVARTRFDASGAFQVVYYDPRPPGPIREPTVSLSAVEPGDETTFQWRVGIRLNLTDNVRTTLSYAEHDLRAIQLQWLSVAVEYAF